MLDLAIFESWMFSCLLLLARKFVMLDMNQIAVDVHANKAELCVEAKRHLVPVTCQHQ